MKMAPKLVVFSALVAASGFGSGLAVHAAPTGPSARMAARLKKYPTSAWLAHYLPDDRYKIAGGVWKYVSTDLDTYYHRPDSALMMSQPADRVIGFASLAEAEEAGYMPGPGIQMERQRMESQRLQRQRLQSLKAQRAMMRSGSGGISPEMLKVLGALNELQAVGNQMKSDKSGNLPLMRQRAVRMLTLLNQLPIIPRGVRPVNKLKSGIRGFISSIDLHTQGNDDAAIKRLAVSMMVIQGAMNELQQVGSARRR